MSLHWHNFLVLQKALSTQRCDGLLQGFPGPAGVGVVVGSVVDVVVVVAVVAAAAAVVVVAVVSAVASAAVVIAVAVVAGCTGVVDADIVTTTII